MYNGFNTNYQLEERNQLIGRLMQAPRAHSCLEYGCLLMERIYFLVQIL